MNLVEAYYNYVKDTEPPINYHGWTMISCLSSLLGRKCYLPQGHLTIYPNLYVVLVGSPGMKKSSAMSVGKTLLRSIEDFPLAPSSMTREALLESLEKNECTYNSNNINLSYHQLTAFVTEFQEFIGQKHRNAGMLDILTAIWDEPTYEYLTRNHKPIVIDKPYVNMLACCTDSWLSEKLDSSIITDGLARRIIFVYESKRNKLVAFPKLTMEQLEAFDFMQQEALRIRAVTGEFSFTEDAYSWWEDFYVKTQVLAESKPIALQHYFTTKHVLMLKVAMCLSIVLRKDKRIDKALLELVDKIFVDVEFDLPMLFKSMGRNELKPYLDKLETFIAESPNRQRTSAECAEYMTNDVKGAELAEAFENLLIRKKIKIVDVLNGSTTYEFIGTRNRKGKFNMFEALLNYVPSTSERIKKEQTPVDLTRVCTQEEKQIIEADKQRIEVFKSTGGFALKRNLAKS